MRKKNLFIIGIACWMLVAFLCGCATKSDQQWSQLPQYSDPAKLDTLTPVWEKGTASDKLDIRIYLEPYKKPKYILDRLQYFATLKDAHVRIYDYLAQSDIESFMVSGIGDCIAEESPDLYLKYLNQIASSSEDVKDELVMASIAKSVLGKNYSRTCLQKNINALKTTFENDNPLKLEQTPATMINGRVVYGDLSTAEWETILRGVK
jgi:hypothetical protein